MKTNLQFKGFALVLVEKFQVFWEDKRDFFTSSFCAEDISKRNVLETFRLTNIIIVGDVTR